MKIKTWKFEIFPSSKTIWKFKFFFNFPSEIKYHNLSKCSQYFPSPVNKLHVSSRSDYAKSWILNFFIVWVMENERKRKREKNGKFSVFLFFLPLFIFAFIFWCFIHKFSIWKPWKRKIFPHNSFQHTTTSNLKLSCSKFCHIILIECDCERIFSTEYFFFHHLILDYPFVVF